MSGDPVTGAVGVHACDYWEAANAYIEALPDTTFLVAVDCHI